MGFDFYEKYLIFMPTPSKILFWQCQANFNQNDISRFMKNQSCNRRSRRKIDSTLNNCPCGFKKKKKCSTCRTLFTPKNMTQSKPQLPIDERKPERANSCSQTDYFVMIAHDFSFP